MKGLEYIPCATCSCSVKMYAREYGWVEKTVRSMWRTWTWTLSLTLIPLFKSNPVRTTEKINASRALSKILLKYFQNHKMASETYICYVFCSHVWVVSTVHKKQMNGVDVWQYYFCLVSLSCMLPWTKAVRLVGYAQFCCSFKLIRQWKATA